MKKLNLRLLPMLVLVTASLFKTSTVEAQSMPAKLPVVAHDDFENGASQWEATDHEMETSVWKIHDVEGNHVLRVTGKSKYKPPFRSPHSIAWLKSPVVGDFDLTVRIHNTRPDAGNHRDLCLFFGGQDAAHFYYVHLGAKPDPHSSQIFIVNEAARTMITENETTGIPWRDDWHDIHIKRRIADGLIEVYFDDMQTPVMVAHDTTFTHGRVGLGTFDDHGNFDNFELRGTVVSDRASATESE